MAYAGLNTALTSSYKTRTRADPDPRRTLEPAPLKYAGAPPSVVQIVRQQCHVFAYNTSGRPTCIIMRRRTVSSGYDSSPATVCTVCVTIHFYHTWASGGYRGGSPRLPRRPSSASGFLQVQAASTQIKQPYTGILNCFVRVFHEQGLASFWRALNFATKDKYKQLFLPTGSKENMGFWWFFLCNMAAGGAAGANSLAAQHPRVHRGLWHCLTDMYATSGLRGLYWGFGVSMGGIIVYRASLFGGYDTARDVWLTKDAPLWQKWIVAQTVQTVAGLLSYPLDTVRRRMMMQVGRPDVLYANTWHCWRTIWTTEGGAPAYFKGAGSNVLRGSGSALVLVLYDEVKAVLSPA
ncbi:hypothetical protein H257_15085 [Aphanomyces astaci]|uniref:ADP/ATP translocase n=1 Tax=Aphanomyces astaci TaxID=112090 RepID=W4FNR7_APHAT|nr:hypothetical protein H257_15085 [Aphanomyces astaci]ETV69122.1 hypothetical protein H257_15085 [Aphanomyces astaci]|eukprot:XP_009841375.1 hypothetical protein H257_15085 [Aphanomyces astaci]